MGSEDLFHKRKAKKAGAIARRKAKRAPYAKVLIICEGEKTEPLYFDDLKHYYGLNSANIEVCGECGSDPVSVVNYAKQRYREMRDAGDPFDRVYCVIDKDAHPNYHEALSVIQQATPKEVFEAITSVPCFEYWLLLHFEPTTRPYAPLPGNSSGNQVLQELKNYLPDYQKGQGRLFSRLIDQLEFAKQNASRGLSAAEANNTDNPTTRVHQVVDFLQNINMPGDSGKKSPTS